MLHSVGSVLALFAWCIWKVVTTPEETEHLHGFDFETPDQTDRKKP
jgi:hypothetical protein